MPADLFFPSRAFDPRMTTQHPAKANAAYAIETIVRARVVEQCEDSYRLNNDKSLIPSDSVKDISSSVIPYVFAAAAVSFTRGAVKGVMSAKGTHHDNKFLKALDCGSATVLTDIPYILAIPSAVALGKYVASRVQQLRAERRQD